jgi:hypothetical protein
LLSKPQYLVTVREHVEPVRVCEDRHAFLPGVWNRFGTQLLATIGKLVA